MKRKPFADDRPHVDLGEPPTLVFRGEPKVKLAKRRPRLIGPTEATRRRDAIEAALVDEGDDEAG
jgi:hypothetical protein